MGEFGYGNIAFHFAGYCVGKAQFRAEGIVVTGKTQRFPVFRNLVSSTEVIFVGDFRVVLEEGLLALEVTQLLHKGAFPFHVAKARQNEELHGAAFFVGPFF